MGHRLLRLVLAMTIAATFSLFAYGQSATSTLSGAVTDPAGEVIAGAQVTVKNRATGGEFRAVTASNGTFSIPALDPGNYSVTISAPGFKQAIVTRGGDDDVGETQFFCTSGYALM